MTVSDDHTNCAALTSIQCDLYNLNLNKMDMTKGLYTPRRRGHVTIHLSKFKLKLKVVTLSTANIGAEAANVTNYSNNYNCI